MFRNKRNSLVKRLWKYRINDETKSSSQKDTSSSFSHSANTSSKEDLELKSVTHSFFKRLKEDQLETLVQAMESRGGEVTPCVPVSKLDLRLGGCVMSPYVLCCRVFRWPDLKSDAEMKRLPSCMRQNEESESVICCNPYHWSLVVKIDEPPIYADRLVRSMAHDGFEKSNDGCPRIIEPVRTGRTPSGYHSEFSENSEEKSGYNCLLWCTIAYWELRERVGRLFSVTEPSVHVFQQLPHGDGMCLQLFQKPSNLEVVKRTREKIGFGIILSREAAHKSDTNTFGLHGVMETTPVNSTQVSMSHLLSQSYLLRSPTQEMIGVDSEKKSNSFYLSTSNSETSVSPTGVSWTDDNVVHGGDSAGCDRKVLKHQLSDDGCGIHLSPDHQHCTSDSMHIGYLYRESMDYMPALGTSPPYYHQQHHLQSQSRSPSCLSSSSFSSSSPSSPPLYFSDTSFSDLHYPSSAGLNYGTLVDTTAASQKSNKSDSHINNSSSSSIKVTTSGTSTDHNKRNGKNTAPSLQTEANTPTSSRGLSTGLPCKQGEIWAYNASNFPIFVNSPTLDDPKSPRSLVVKKVPPGYSIKIFDYARADLLERTEARSELLNDGPFDPCSVRISLAKGWGPNYSRQFITSCPCWLEILLGVRRHSSAS